MINALRNDDLSARLGGKFSLAALIQRRLKELIEGARPLVETQGRTLVEVVIQEIAEKKIGIDFEKSDGIESPTPDAAKTGADNAAAE